MAANVNRELIAYLRASHPIEQHGLSLLTKATKLTGDEQIAEIYRAHCPQTEEHARQIAERVDAHGERHFLANDEVPERILEQEEQAVEIFASTFDRALEVSLGEPRLARQAISPRLDRSMIPVATRSFRGRG